MTKLKLSVFISSPGDVGDERRIAERVLLQLQGKYAALTEIRPIVWEHEPVRATETFQRQIEQPANADVVICILWSRLGTRLPEDFDAASGKTYESGTAYEFETAKAAFDVHGRPDLLVYRKTAQPLVDVRDVQEVQARSQQWASLVEYLDEWFRNPDGSFKAGFTQFERLDEFEELLERHMDALIRRRLAEVPDRGETGDRVEAIIWAKGSPFRGLEVFEFEHANIFHGRTRAIAEAKDRLVQQAMRSCAFLLVYGMSGSGKSSMVRAGLLPTITEPGVVEGIGLWRYAVMRPSDGESPLSALMDALTGETALPELTMGDFTIPELESILRESPERAMAPVRGALGRAAQALRAELSLYEAPEARLAVLVDQLEELFTDDRINAGARLEFVNALLCLTQSGYVWIIATIRSDFYHRCAEIPALVTLKDALGSYELLPPRPAEIRQLIAIPAQTAGLRYEESEEDGRLDDVLQREAERDPTALPLLEFVLDALYDACDNRQILTFEAYRSLGGLEGAIASRAEEVLKKQPLPVSDALPSVIRSLVVIRGDAEQTNARTTPLELLSSTPERRALVDALVGARLLVSHGEGGDVFIRVAHEALLKRWPRARKVIERDRDFLQVRTRLQEDTRQWQRQERSPDLLLPPGRRLAEAEELNAHRRDELESGLLDYIDASVAADRRRRSRRRKLVVGVIATLIVALGLTGWQWRLANQQARIALSRKLAVDADAALAEGKQDLALLLSLEGQRFAPTEESLNSLVLSLESEPFLWAKLRGHQGGVRAIAFSGDGNALASGDSRGFITTWAPESGKSLKTVGPNPWGSKLSTLAIAADGETLAVGTDGGRVYLTGTRQDARDLGVPPRCRKILNLAFGDRGHLLASCSYNIWAWSDGHGWQKRKHPFSGTAAFSNDGGTAIIASKENQLIVWRIENPSAARRIDLGKTKVPAYARFDANMVVSRDGKLFAFPAWSEGASLWHGETPRPLLEVAPGRRRRYLALHPDKSWLAVGDGRDIMLYRLSTVRPLAIASSLTDPARFSLALSRDEQVIGVGSESGSLHLRRADDGQPIGVPLSGLHGDVEGVVFHYELGPLAVTRTFDGLLLYDPQTGKTETQVYPSTEASVADRLERRYMLAVTAENNGQVLAVHDAGGDIVLWNLSEGTNTRWTVCPPADSDCQPKSAVFSSDGRYLFVGTSDGRLGKWSLSREVPQIDRTTTRDIVWHGGFERLVLSDNGQRLVAIAASSEVSVYDASTLETLGTPLLDAAYRVTRTSDVAISPNGQWVAAATSSGVVIWNLALRYPDPPTSGGRPGKSQEGLVQRLKQFHAGLHGGERLASDEGSALAFSPDGRSLAIGQNDGTISIWDITQQSITAKVPSHFPSRPKLKFSPSGETLAAYDDGFLVLWDVRQSRGLALAHAQYIHTAKIQALGFSMDRQWLASADQDGKIALWETGEKDHAEVRIIEGSPKDVSAIGFGGIDSRTLILGSRKGSVMIAQPDAREMTPAWSAAKRAEITAVLLAPDGKRMAVGQGRQLIVIENGTDRPLDWGADRLGRKIGRINALAFDPSGASLLSGGPEQGIAEWRLSDGIALVRPLVGAQELYAVWMSSEDKAAVFGRMGREIGVWKVTLDNWEARACRIANRDLTDDEWDTYIGDNVKRRNTCMEAK